MDVRFEAYVEAARRGLWHRVVDNSGLLGETVVLLGMFVGAVYIIHSAEMGVWEVLQTCLVGLGVLPE